MVHSLPDVPHWRLTIEDHNKVNTHEEYGNLGMFDSITHCGISTEV